MHKVKYLRGRTGGGLRTRAGARAGRARRRSRHLVVVVRLQTSRVTCTCTLSLVARRTPSVARARSASKKHALCQNPGLMQHNGPHLNLSTRSGLLSNVRAASNAKGVDGRGVGGHGAMCLCLCVCVPRLRTRSRALSTNNRPRCDGGRGVCPRGPPRPPPGAPAPAPQCGTLTRRW